MSGRHHTRTTRGGTRLTCILDEIDALALEDTQWKNLIKSARGTSLDPGRNVNAKRALNRRIATVAPGRLRLKLTSMCAHKGVWLVLTEPAKLSTTCNKCGKSNPKNRKTQTEFRCTRCNHIDNADANAAKNHRERGRNTMWKRLHNANQRHNERMTTGGHGCPLRPLRRNPEQAHGRAGTNPTNQRAETGGVKPPTRPVGPARGRDAMLPTDEQE